MRTSPLLAGVAAGAILGLGGVLAADMLTDEATGQGDGGGLAAANNRSIRAIKQGVIAYNLLAKYVAEPGQLVSVRKPANIRQDRGVGGGLPGATIADGAISEPKLAAAVRAKLNAAGTQGPAGPAGPAGAVPSTYAQSGPGFADPALDGNLTRVVSSAGSVPGSDGGGALALSEPKRIIADGWVDVEGTGAGSAICRPAVVDGTTTSLIGPSNGVTVPDGTTVRVAVSGARDLDPGTYDLQVICQGSAATAVAATITATLADR